MKKIFFSLIVLCFILPLAAQQELLSILKSEEKPLIEQVKKERKELAILEEEIAYFYSLLQQRSAVRELYKKGKVAELIKVFSKNVKILDRLFEENRIRSIGLKISEQEIIYGDVKELQDQLLFYRGKLAFVKEEMKKAQRLLEDLVQNYPQSVKLNPGMLILEEIYFREGFDEKLIAIFDRHTVEKTIEQNYWLAQAYYNTGKHEDAKIIFNILKKDKKFGFRANAMLAMLVYFTDGIEKSIEDFHTLQGDYKASDKYFNFTNLSLARLYVANGEISTGLNFYEKYYEHQKEDLSDDLLYEIALQFYNNANFNKAIAYFNQIIKKAVKSEYFASAKFLVSVSEQGRGNYDMAENTLSEIISRNNILLETMNAKYRLLTKHNDTRKKLTKYDISDEERDELQQQSDDLEVALRNTNKTMLDLYTGMDTNTLNILQLLEEEYLSYSSTIADIDAIIMLANTIPNTRIPAIIDREIAATDSSIITLQIINYLGHRSRFTYKDYNFARALAVEKVYQDNLLKTWNDIEQTAIDNKHTELINAIRKSKQLVEENLESIDVIAQYMFKGKPSDELQQIIQDESEAIGRNRDNLISLKKEVIANFNKIIARRLSKEKEILVAEFESLTLSYNKALSYIMNEITYENDKYQFSLLGVLFKQTQILDEEYKEYQEKVRNE